MLREQIGREQKSQGKLKKLDRKICKNINFYTLKKFK